MTLTPCEAVDLKAPGDGENVVVHAALPVNVEPDDTFGFAVVDLPEVEAAATIVHRGSNREVTLACPEDVDGWVTELQEPVRQR